MFKSIQVSTRMMGDTDDDGGRGGRGGQLLDAKTSAAPAGPPARWPSAAVPTPVSYTHLTLPTKA